MRIVHFSTWDTVGGAAKSAYRLHQSLLQLGCDSRMAVLEKFSPDPTVEQFTPSMAVPTRIARGLRRRYLNAFAKHYTPIVPGSTIFSDCRSQYRAEPARMAANAQVANLHWTTDFVDPPYFFRGLPPSTPVVWTLHDMNPFTGGCHYAFDCSGFAATCANCPQLPPDKRNRSHKIWKYKQSALGSLGSRNLQVVAPSRWLADQARRSSLLGRFPISVIPYSLDTRVFQPRPREAARLRLGIPSHSHVLLFMADSTNERRKGLHILSSAVSSLQDMPDLKLLVVGKSPATSPADQRTVYLDFVQNEELLSLTYSAADLFVIPSTQDNLPNTALEALSCGVPVVGSRAGGIPEIVRDNITGLLFENGDPQDLARAVRLLLASAARRLQMSESCRRTAVQEYDLLVQARRYESLYRELCTTSAT